MKERIGVVTAGAYPLLQAGIKCVLAAEKDIKLLAYVQEGMAICNICQIYDLHVVLLFGRSCHKTLSALRAQPVKVLVLAPTDVDYPQVRATLTAGVSGYMLIDEPTAMIVQTIRTVAQGGRWVSPRLMVKMMPPADKRVEKCLTKREREVLQWIVKGFSNKEIASALSIKERTVVFHVSNILRKLNMVSRVEAAVWAKSQGIV